MKRLRNLFQTKRTGDRGSILDLIAEAQQRSGLDDDQAMELAVYETRQVRNSKFNADLDNKKKNA